MLTSQNDPTSSWWHRSVSNPPTFSPLDANRTCDIAIIGGGFSGLWAALYVKREQPDLSVVVLEKDYLGYGASGRNGGWCMGASTPEVADYDAIQPGSGLRMEHAMYDTVDEVARMCGEFDIDCDYHKGGILYYAPSELQMEAIYDRIAGFRQAGITEQDFGVINPNELAQHLKIDGTYGGLYTPHGAVINPYKLVVGLASAAGDLGVEIFEHSPVTGFGQNSVSVGNHRVDASVIIKCTEGYSVQLPEFERSVVPVYSYMIATEPLSDAFWDRAGLDDRPAFADHTLMPLYAQRTKDNRIAIGGLAIQYCWNSKINHRMLNNHPSHRLLEKKLHELFPWCDEIRTARRWGGLMGLPRDFMPSVGFESESGFAWAGGYFGEGVGASNLGARIVRDLVLDRDTALTELPWVNHQSPQWESEPIRFIGAVGISKLMRLADVLDEKQMHRSRALLNRLIGRFGMI